MHTLSRPFCTWAAAGEKSQPLTVCHSSHDAHGTRRDISCRAAAALIACQDLLRREACLAAIVSALLAAGAAPSIQVTGATTAPVKP